MVDKKDLFIALINIRAFCARHLSCYECPLHEAHSSYTECLLQDEDVTPDHWKTEMLEKAAHEIAEEMNKEDDNA